MSDINFSSFAWFLKTDAEEIIEAMEGEERDYWLEHYEALLALAED